MSPDYFNGSNQLNQAQCPQPADIFDQLRQAQALYHGACRRFAEAAMEREQSQKNLQELTEKCAAIMQQALSDPTAPVDSAPVQIGQLGPRIGNGRW